MRRDYIAQPLHKSLPLSYKLFARSRPLNHGTMKLIDLAPGLSNTTISYTAFPPRSAEAKAKRLGFLFTNLSAGRVSRGPQFAPGPKHPVRIQTSTRPIQMMKNRRLLPRTREARNLFWNLRLLRRLGIVSAAEVKHEGRVRHKSRIYKTDLSALRHASRVWHMVGQWMSIAQM